MAPATGGRELLAAAAAADTVVVGRVEQPTQIDRLGWRATLVVERSLLGDDAPEAALLIAWEELATRRPARFVAGERVVVVLEPLPPGSLWTARFPKRDALAIAARGEAFLRDPDQRTLRELAAWLALPSPDRDGEAGVAALARLAAVGEATVAESALAWLERVPALPERLSADAAQSLTDLIADGGRPIELRRAVVTLVGHRELQALEPALVALASTPSPLQGDALDALGRLRGGLGAARVAELLRARDPAVRAAAVRHAAGAVDVSALRSLLRNDPAGAVRAAAAEALAQLEPPDAADDLVRSLRDDEPAVRLAAMQGIAALGAPALGALRREIWDGAAVEASGSLGPAVLTLGLFGPEGLAELRRIVHEHPSQQIRRLAELTLGKLPEQH
ncbi:HEAT repeat domain-containing protein [Myxococcota bacterium]|nr:HEAT repeat domain-containing protein [Myxococcota bacterium]MCZ7620582.1 HEAT repeat domain-containing protein [Myxococcota bacterium]